MASKYAKILPHLPKYVDPDKDHADRVAQVQSEILLPPVALSEEEKAKAVQQAARKGQQYLELLVGIAEEPPVGVEESLLTVESLGTALSDLLARMNHVMVQALNGERPTAATASRLWAAMRDVKDTLNDNMSLTELTLEAYQQITVNAYEQEGLDGLKHDDGTSVRAQPEPYSVVTDKDRYREWCIKNGLERSLQVMWQTTNSMVKERLLNGDDLPEGVEATVKTKLVLTRGK